MAMSLNRVKFPVIVLLLQLVFIVIFAVFVDYEDAADPTLLDVPSPLGHYYPMFQDIHVMIFIGFGFLYTFLQRYGYSGVGFNLTLGALTIQWTIIIRGLFFGNLAKGDSIKLSQEEMITGDFNAATVLISFGALIGKTGPLQLLVMTILEVVFANLNEYVGTEYLKVSDIGGSMFVHAFGAYFGLAASRVLYNKSQEKSPNLGTSYQSDVFALIGSLFLWCFWPSFNGGLAEGDERLRAVINTFTSLVACVVVTMAISSIVNKGGKFEASHLQNATLAGGVAVGTCANMPIKPWGALVLGAVAAFVSVVGYRFVSDFLCSKMKIQDPAGVNNLHGMPGILAAIAGAVTAALATEKKFGHSLYQIFPQMAPPVNTTAYDDMMDKNWTFISPGDGRTAVMQGGYQMAALTVTLVISIIGGVLTGFVMRLPIWDAPNDNELYDDRCSWNVPNEGFPNDQPDAVDRSTGQNIGLLKNGQIED